MRIEYRPPRRKQPLFAAVKRILRVFIRKAQVISLDGPVQEGCLYVANHANKMGPVNYDMFFPAYNVKWGAHQMLEGYAARRAYLRDVLYIQKNGMGRKKAAFKAFWEAFFSCFFYRGLKILPTYPDGRLARTVKTSVEILDDNSAVMIFPENSEGGYHDEMISFFSGFVMVMDRYYKTHGKDVPVRPVYYGKRGKRKVMVVGKAFYGRDLAAQGLDRNGVAEFFRLQVNDLYRRIQSGEFDGQLTGGKLNK